MATKPVIPPDELEVLGDLSDIKTVLELGNKRDKKGVPYRAFYEDQGIKYSCLDINGLDGALMLDMSEPLIVPDEYDLITNFGFTEHVINQIQCWTNVHNLLSMGGRLVCVTPYPGQWEGHGYYQPHPTFYNWFAGMNGYVGEVWCNTNRVRHTVCTSLTKGVSEEDFWVPTQFLHRTPLRFT